MSPVGPPSPAPVTIGDPVPRRFRTVEAAALAGLAHAALYVTAIALFRRAPGPDADVGVITHWYRSSANQRTLLTGLNLIVAATVAFVWFVAVIRRRAGERENRFFGTVFLGSALILAAMWLVGAMVNTAPALTAYVYGYEPDVGDIAMWRGASVATLLVLVVRLQAVFVISATTVIRLAGTFPRPIVHLGYATGLVLMLTPFPSEVLYLVFPIWVAVVSASALVTQRLAGSVVDEPDLASDGDGLRA